MCCRTHSGATYLYFVAGFQIAAISNLYGATCAGGLTGGYFAKKISQNQVDLKKYFEKPLLPFLIIARKISIENSLRFEFH